jgi:Protein of unknown function (DUF2795)
MTQGNLGDLGNLDVATLLQYLPGVRFPAEKEQIASTAESNGAPQELVKKIRVQAANDSMLLTRSCRRSKAAKLLGTSANKPIMHLGVCLQQLSNRKITHLRDAWTTLSAVDCQKE